MDDTLTLRLSPQRLDYIVNVLALRPWQEVDPVLADIRNQVARQQMPPQPIATRPNGHDMGATQ